MQNLSIFTAGFRAEDYDNLLCCKSPSARTLPLFTYILPVCPVHSAQFDEGLFALVPSSGQREI